MSKGGVPHNKERREQVVALRAQGLTLAEIGLALVPPISKQRVAQLLNPNYRAPKLLDGRRRKA